MMKYEFEKLTGAELLEEEYKIVEKVYTFHPADFSKADMASIYKMGGLSLIFDLEVAAFSMEELDQQERELEKVSAEIEITLSEIEDKKRYYKNLYKNPNKK